MVAGLMAPAAASAAEGLAALLLAAAAAVAGLMAAVETAAAAAAAGRTCSGCFSEIVTGASSTGRILLGWEFVFAQSEQCSRLDEQVSEHSVCKLVLACSVLVVSWRRSS